MGSSQDGWLDDDEDFIPRRSEGYSMPIQSKFMPSVNLVDQIVAAVSCKDIISQQWIDLTFSSARLWEQVYTTEKDNRLSLLSHGYILLKIIGKGSFAVIWKAVCERKHGNSFYVAIKVASNTTDSRIDVVSWLKNEAMIISKLSGHPNIVSFYGEIQIKELYCITLGLEDCSMDICMDSIWNEDKTSFILNQIVRGYLHLRLLEVVHLDMKPTNILIQNVNEHWSQWKIKICDFGLAISGISSEMNIQDLRTTTFRYMSPQRTQRVVDASADIWSIGIMMYEILHGYKPFELDETNNEVEMRESFFGTNPKELILREDLSSTCKDLLKKLLTIDSKERITIDELEIHPFLRKQQHSNNVHMYKYFIITILLLFFCLVLLLILYNHGFFLFSPSTNIIHSDLLKYLRGTHPHHNKL